MDDHDLLRIGLRELLACVPGYALVGEGCSAYEAIALIELARPDIVVMDLALPGMDGITATREILQRAPEARIIILTAHGHRNEVIDAINAGAIGYVLKTDPPASLLQALDHATRGAFYIAPAFHDCVSAFAAPRPVAVLDVLSERERDVFRLAADCSTSNEIARQLRITRKTVDTHLGNINRKLGLRDRAQLVRLALGMGAVDARSSDSSARQ